MRAHVAALVACCACSAIGASRTDARQVEFEWLPGFTTQFDHVYASAVSADGSVIVGWAMNDAMNRIAFRWTKETGIVGLGEIPGGRIESAALAVSGDGSVVVGNSNTYYGSDPADETKFASAAFRWSSGDGLQQLEPLGSGVSSEGFPYHPASIAYSASHDGSIVVGARNSDAAYLGEGVIWGPQGSQALGGATALDISADGQVVALSTGDLWTSTGGFVDIPGLIASIAISSDGSVVLGRDGSNPVKWQDPVIWSEEDGIVDLDLSRAFAINGDGTVVAGARVVGPYLQAAIWTSATGSQLLADILEANGVDLSGWRLDRASGISDDGTVVVGYAFNTTGAGVRSFRAVIPGPPHWTNGLGGSYSDPANWSSAAVPDDNQVAIFDTSASYVVTFDADEANALVRVAENQVSFDLGGLYTYSVGSLVVDADVPTVDEAQLTIEGGTVAVSGDAAGVFVGESNKGQLVVTDTGWLNVQEGLTVGSSDDSEGVVSVTGVGARLTVASPAFVGDEGTGTVYVNQGGFVIAENSVVIGAEDGSNGSVFVSDQGTQWLSTDTVYVGVNGVGTLGVGSGAGVTAAGMIVGADSDGSGSVTVIGANSALTVNNDLIVGDQGFGNLQVLDSATVVVDGTAAIGPFGGLEVSQGSVWVGGEQLGKYTGVTSSNGTAATEPEFRVDTLVVEEGGAVTANAVVVAEGGVLSARGELSAALVNSGAIAPGAEPGNPGRFSVNADYEQTAEGALEIELGGSTGGSEFDVLTVTGSATLAGVLRVSLIDDFDPVVGSSFVVVTAADVQGTFDVVESATPGLAVSAQYGPGSVVLWVTQSVGTDDQQAAADTKATITGIYPNPGRGLTTIAYAVPAATTVRAEVMDLLGRRVSTLADATLPTGAHELSFDTDDWASGVYFVRMMFDDRTPVVSSFVVR